jgi:FO synthase subunit 2
MTEDVNGSDVGVTDMVLAGYWARHWGSLDRPVRQALDRALAGDEVTLEDGLALAEAKGRELNALAVVADELRARQAGDVVTYVVNRNINFTNVCIKHCTFCA